MTRAADRMTSTMLAVLQEQVGGPESLRVGRCPTPVPGPGEVLVRVTRSAVNWSDERSCRTGANHFTGEVEPLPGIPGGEVVGTRCDTGERVAALCRTGGFAQFVAAPEKLVFPVPDAIDDATTLGVFVPGLTATFLIAAAGDPGPGTAVAVFGANGAVGSLLLPLLADRGVGTRVAGIREAGSPHIALRRGATATVDPSSPRLAADLRSAARGPLDVVFDPVGAPVTPAAVEALGTFGRLLCYGVAGGAPAGLEPRSLFLGSKTVTGFWVMDHLSAPGPPASRPAHSSFTKLCAMAGRGRFAVAEPRVFGLHDAGTAMRTVGGGGPGRVLIDPWIPADADRVGFG